MSRNFIRTLGTLAATIVALPLAACATGSDGEGAPAAESVTLQFASYLGPLTPESQALQWAFDEIHERSDGRITIDPVWEGGLLGGADILHGVAQGRAELGYLTMLYNPGELPLSQMATVPFVTDDPSAVRAAYAELYESNEAFRAEWDATGVIPLSFQGNPISIMGTTEPVDGLSDLAGHSIRAVGYTAEAVQMAGANPVAITSPEIYESMQRGVIDGYTTQLFDVIPTQSLQEVSNFVVDPGIGVYTVNSLIVGQSVWGSLTEEQQAIISEVAAEIPEQHFELLAASEDAACAALEEVGATVSVWGQAEKDAWRELVGDQLIDQWNTAAVAAGADADALWEQYTSLLDESSGDFESGIARCADA